VIGRTEPDPTLGDVVEDTFIPPPDEPEPEQEEGFSGDR
jgi:hypothetical protein